MKILRITWLWIMPLFLLVALRLDSQAESQVKQGEIRGLVRDLETQRPLAGVQVLLKGQSLQTQSDPQGRFFLTGVAVGSHILELNHSGYAVLVKPDVIVRPRRITFIEVDLQKMLQEEVLVVGGYFAPEQTQQSSLAVMSSEEVRRSPGSAGDITRALTSLPAVARINDLFNCLAVRGGSSLENGFLVDQIPVPEINHFSRPGLTGGAIGMINVDLIRDLTFYTGGFPAVYGDRLSSILDISLREGNRERFEAQAGLDMSGFGLTGEGPLGKSASWLLSLRRSYLDWVLKLINTKIDSNPRYANGQAKVVLDLSPYSRLTFLALDGIDDEGLFKETSLEKGNSYYGGYKSYLYTMGINWRQLWKNGGYSSTSFAYSFRDTGREYFSVDDDRLESQETMKEKLLQVRHINSVPLGSRWRLEFGFDAKTAANQVRLFLGRYTDIWGKNIPEQISDNRLQTTQAALFLQTVVHPLERLTLNLGVRADYLSRSRRFHLSPRFSFSLQLNARASLNGSCGLFFQELPTLFFNQGPLPRDFRDLQSRHLILGFSQMLGQSTRLTLEAYDKRYKGFPLDPRHPASFFLDELTVMIFGRPYPPSAAMIDTGQAHSWGLEATLQKKLAWHIYGLVSAAYFRSRYRDFNGDWHDRVFDNRWIFNLEGGYKPDNKWQMSLRWVYAGGTPYTPYDIKLSNAANIGIYDDQRVNAERNPDYHTLNLRLDRRFNFRRSNLALYLEVWNIYDRKNIAYRNWNRSARRPEIFAQLGRVPILGMELEF
jgi:hypothetical protein